MAKNPDISELDSRFLALWRQMEQALKDHGNIMVLDLENNLKSQSRAEDASKLCICRQVRNFMTHDGPGFVHASDAMLQFVADMTYEIERVNGTVKDQMITAARYGALDIDEPADKAAALVLAKKHRDILILDINNDKALAGVMGAKALAMALADNAGGRPIRYLADHKALDMPSRVIKSDTPMSKAPGISEKAVVVDSKNRCVGVLNPEGTW